MDARPFWVCDILAQHVKEQQERFGLEGALSSSADCMTLFVLKISKDWVCFALDFASNNQCS